MMKTETKQKAPDKKPLACPFLSNTHYEIPCMQKRCAIYNHVIKRCGLVDLAITMHNIERYLMQLLDSRSRG